MTNIGVQYKLIQLDNIEQEPILGGTVNFNLQFIVYQINDSGLSQMKALVILHSIGVFSNF